MKYYNKMLEKVLLIAWAHLCLFGRVPMPPIPGDDPAPLYTPVTYTYNGYKIEGNALVTIDSFATGEFLGDAIIEGGCVDSNNQWNIAITGGWSSRDGWFVNYPSGSLPSVSSFGTQKVFYWPPIPGADPGLGIPYIAYFTYSFGYNTNSTFTTYWSAYGQSPNASIVQNVGGIANVWSKSGTNHDTYRVGPVLVWGYPTYRGMAGTVAQYSQKDSLLGWNGDSCLWAVELYRAIPTQPIGASISFSVSASIISSGDTVDIPLFFIGTIDPSRGVGISSVKIRPFSQSFTTNVAYTTYPGFNLDQFVAERTAQLSILDPSYPARYQAFQGGTLPSGQLLDGRIIYLGLKPFLRVKVVK